VEGPEALDPLDAGFLAKFLDGQLLDAELLRKSRHREQMNELVTFHDVVLFDAAPLCELLKVDEREY
jgi:hypothetical protein